MNDQRRLELRGTPLKRELRSIWVFWHSETSFLNWQKSRRSRSMWRIGILNWHEFYKTHWGAIRERSWLPAPHRQSQILKKPWIHSNMRVEPEISKINQLLTEIQPHNKLHSFARQFTNCKKNFFLHESFFWPTIFNLMKRYSFLQKKLWRNLAVKLQKPVLLWV